MKDIAIDENFEIIIGARNDLEMVEGRKQFEQSLSIWLTTFFYEEIGTFNSSEALSRVELQVDRIARQNGRLEDISSVVVEPSVDIPDAIDVSVVYLTGETFGLNLQ
ncbi:hypothetical protein [Natronorubrum bangense]|uniref:Uncharacterized protein n=2 Tax=Natronorubrum bangense TaxID=61858 RepID=L9WK93_9EURY|nr:hypothetical protein [Natronorubrum bangense]ELY49905.1 hypothetical protein C494_07840 [Natronorubrum bangense JCM 10635]QCC55522.1 hypothetical protein DV706_14215 [Natronorubrum bangense]